MFLCSYAFKANKVIFTIEKIMEKIEMPLNNYIITNKPSEKTIFKTVNITFYKTNIIKTVNIA